MDWKMFFTIFSTVFIAELGDKTQLATMLFSTDKKNSLLMIFVAASAALVLSTLIGVFAGKFVGTYVSQNTLKNIAGVGFIAIGLFTLLSKG